MGASGRAARNAAMDGALRRACKASSASTGSPCHSLCRMTLQDPCSMEAQRAAVRQLPLFARRVPGVTMRTIDRERATIARLYESTDLTPALRDARARTLAIYAGLDLDAVRFPRLPIVNPALWELAHIAWFQERWCRRYDPARRTLARDSILPRADAFFDSSAVPHATRWTLDHPGARELLRYMDDTLEATCGALAGAAP